MKFNVSEDMMTKGLAIFSIVVISVIAKLAMLLYMWSNGLVQFHFGKWLAKIFSAGFIGWLVRLGIGDDAPRKYMAVSIASMLSDEAFKRILDKEFISGLKGFIKSKFFDTPQSYKERSKNQPNEDLKPQDNVLKDSQ